jgi:heptosyltransferase-2
MRYGLVNDRRELDKSKLPTTVSRYAALGLAHDAALTEDLPQPVLCSDPERVNALRTRLDLMSTQPVIALLPGAEYGPAKQWSADRFAQLARMLSEAGMQIWVFGSAKEVLLGEEICAGSNARNLCGRTELIDVVDLLSCAAVAVSNDSGLMHVAAATDCAVVAIYGSTSPAFTPPLTHRARMMVETQPCSPCFARTCRYDHYRCLTDIGVDGVSAAVMEMLSHAA